MQQAPQHLTLCSEQVRTWGLSGKRVQDFVYCAGSRAAAARGRSDSGHAIQTCRCRHCLLRHTRRGPGTQRHACACGQQHRRASCNTSTNTLEHLQVVEALTQGGPAEASGKFEIGDVLNSIDSAPVANMTDRISPVPSSCFCTRERVLDRLLCPDTEYRAS